MTRSIDASEHGELDQLLRGALKSQYRAALAMLRQAVERCPDALWVQGNPPFWRAAYHTAFFAHFYLGLDVAAFRAWEHHRARSESLDAPPAPKGEPYARAQVLEYLSQCEAMVDPAIDALDLTARDPGFPWYQVSKVEHQIINIRHIQHHTIYLSAALRAAGCAPVEWISPTRSSCSLCTD
jgi:hypothetical protein